MSRCIFLACDVSNKQVASKRENVMKRMNAMLSLASFALASLIFCKATLAQQPPDNVEGNWTIYSTNIENGETVVKHVQIAQYGNRITGYFEGPDQSGPIQGEVDVHHIRFSTVTRNVLTFRGQIYGDSMSGLYGLHGRHAQWQAARTTGVGLAVPTATVTTYQYQPVQTVQAPAIQPPAEPAPQAAPQPSAPATSQSNYGSTPAPQSADQLNALVAPIALYPDALIAQILAASTVPDQVAIADYWVHQNSNLTGEALEQAVDQQSWDPSVKALTQFPSILDDLAKNLAWASSLGQAFQNQQADVMSAVQAMRAKAQAAGTLQSNAQITVTQGTPGTIVIQPANPQVVYIPQYNPTIVYGAPIAVPLYTPPLVFAAPTLTFGAGIAVFGGGGAFVAGGGFGWGFHAWACNWGGGGGGSTIIYNHTTYINHTTYNGYHPWGPGPHGPGPYGPNSYHPGTDTHYGPNGGYHPNGYFGPNGGFHHDVPGTNPNNQPNGGNNGNHGLIGGNGGVQNPNAGRNGPGVAPAGGYSNGMNNTGGLQQHTAANNLAATNREPNSLGAERSNEGSYGNRSWNQNNSRMSGNGAASRAESNRGRTSMGGRRPQQRTVRQHAPVERHSSGGGRRR
jgi:uncharacterized protein DUF3300